MSFPFLLTVNSSAESELGISLISKPGLYEFFTLASSTYFFLREEFRELGKLQIPSNL